MRKWLKLSLGAIVLGATGVGVAAKIAGPARVWPLSIFYLQRQANETRPGATVADFRLTDARGANVALADLLHDGRSAVLVFYRGHW